MTRSSLPIPQCVLDAREQIHFNWEQSRRASDSSGDYQDGYHDACRHALKALPPHLVHPDPEDMFLDDDGEAA